MLEALARGGHAPSSGSTPVTSLATQALPPDPTGRHQMKKGSTWLWATLAARAVARTRGSYLAQ
jgi:hypothetical protein